MTGLKSGSGDDLWGSDGDTDEEGAAPDGAESPSSGARTTDETSNAAAAEATHESGAAGTDDESLGGSADDGQPYIVRRAIQDKSVQFEREERLTFFVHDDVADGERELVTELESALGRSVPKFDVREAVYRAALRNPDDVLDELLKMGYARDEE
ncbi:hypothetical protein [Halegenticoccus tardaugens]|uniref:hypothetical protein n=1 Tax=Halegenticoccus tardaugens TaxID=2071624 RepID=UPI00100AA2B1|nr:hypothetical protein [Halegenticoccus tardaugens]